MFNHSVRFSQHSIYDWLIKLVLSVLILCLLCPIKFEIKSSIPITLQSLVMLMCAIWSGWRIGVSAICIYIFLGAIGFPVYAGYESGIEKLTGPTSGFFSGFITAGFICGIFVSRSVFQKPIGNLLLWIIGHFIILFFGAVWISFYTNEWMGIIMQVLPGATIKILTGWLLTQLLLQFVRIKKSS